MRARLGDWEQVPSGLGQDLGSIESTYDDLAVHTTTVSPKF